MSRATPPPDADETELPRPGSATVGAFPLTTLLLSGEDFPSAGSPRDTKAALAEIGVTPPEATLFNLLHFGLTVPPADLQRRATIPDYWIGGPVTPESAATALADGCQKNWLQVVDEERLAGLRNEIRSAQILGPIYDYPRAGGVDFTAAGADKWLEICAHLWRADFFSARRFCDLVHEKTAHFYSSHRMAIEERESHRKWSDVVALNGPHPIGPWRANWWRRFPEGFRLDVEQRWQWQGRGGSGGPFLFFNPLHRPFDEAHAQAALSRHHINWAEWLVMGSLERTSFRHRLAHDACEHSQRLGCPLSPAECEQAIETCLETGWLRPFDQDATDEIHRTLRADPASMPVPFEPFRMRVDHSVDFTSKGALLYRSVSAEIFGADWEEGLQVEDCYFREVHWYCPHEAGLQAIHDECRSSRETPSSLRIVPIGPWCVYWWERFASGYRVELTYGEL